MSGRAADVLVIGGGVFGVWTARALRRSGCSVRLLDMADPGHPAASSGGESRITRCMYGLEELYAEWAWTSLREWRALSERTSRPLFLETGVLWMHRADDPFAEASYGALRRLGIPVERLDPAELRARFPILRVESEDRALLEPRGGALLAGRAVARVAAELVAEGAEVIRGRARPVRSSSAVRGALPWVETVDGRRFEAERFVVAGGPWLDRLCPDAMDARLFVTRQEVLFFDVAPEETGGLPVWADMPHYGFPPIAARGFKVAHDRHGPRVGDVDALVREVAPTAEEEARSFLARRFPALANRSVVDARVCQYANSSNGDFLIDRHPDLENVWLVGCGSGHGFKQGPAVGVHAAELVLGTGMPIPRFGLAAKRTEQARAIQ